MPNENDNNKTFIDYIILSKNNMLIEKFFDEVNEISNEFLSEIINKIILLFNYDMFKIAYENVSKKKFKNNIISFEALSLNINSTPKMFNLVKNFPRGNLSSIKIKNAVKYCRPSFLEILLNNRDILNQEINPIELLEIAVKEKRNDNKMIILKYFPNLDKDNSYNNFYKNLESIENIMITNKFWYLDKKILSTVNDIIKNNKFGLFKLPKSKLFLTHFLIIKGFLKYIDYHNELDLLLKDDDSKTAYEFAKFLHNILEDCFKYYTKYDGFEKNIANFITILDKYITFLKEENIFQYIIKLIFLYVFEQKTIFPDKFYSLENNENKTIFHIISQFDENDSEMEKKIISKYQELKSYYSLKKLGQLFSKQDIQGKTILMNCLKNHQLELAQKIITELGEYLDFTLYDIKGNSLLHYLFLMKKELVLIKKGELELILNLCLSIIAKNPKLIITQNFDGYTPWLLAAKAGIPGALLLMSKFYNSSTIEKYSKDTSAIHEAAGSNKIKVLKSLVEYFRYDINSKIIIKEKQILAGNENEIVIKKKVDIVPLHFAARTHSIKTFKLLVEMGANPYIKNYEKKDSISIMLQNCDDFIFDFLFNSRIFKANFFNGIYLIDLLTTKYGIKHIINYLKNNGFNGIKIFNPK